MKTKLLNIFLVSAMILGVSSCDLNYFPSDELNGNVLLSDEGGAEYIINGCYSMLKDEYEFLGYASGNTYIRHYFQFAEYPGDNVTLSGRTTDPLYEATTYKMTDNLKNVGTLWWVGYKVCFTANSLIEGFPEGTSAQSDQIIGEAYFLRALMHFQLVNLFAKPYAQGRDNMGIPLRISTNTEVTTRATVGEVYDQVVLDLQKAASLMKGSRGNGGVASHDAALGLLSRVYLYMGENQKVIDTVNEALGGAAPAGKLDADYAHYFANAVTSKETLFAVAHTALETRGQSSIGSMYINDGIGWGEVYCSDPLLNLYERYPSDVRYSYIVPNFAASGKDVVTFPIKSDAGDDFRSNLTAEVKTDGSGKYCEIEGTKYRINEKTVNGEYTEYYVTYGGEDCPARLSKAMVSRNTYPNYYVSKFSYQDGDPMLSSPVMLRWAEVILNRAEAYAKLGQDANALADVNVIRERAGIPAAGMFAAGNMHGYANALDVVLDERRMELAFEGHRVFDVYRNNLPMDRRFAGVQTWEVVQPTDNRIQLPIPYSETSVSGIPQNPGY